MQLNKNTMNKNKNTEINIFTAWVKIIFLIPLFL